MKSLAESLMSSQYGESNSNSPSESSRVIVKDNKRWLWRNSNPNNNTPPFWVTIIDNRKTQSKPIMRHHRLLLHPSVDCYDDEQGKQAGGKTAFITRRFSLSCVLLAPIDSWARHLTLGFIFAFLLLRTHVSPRNTLGEAGVYSDVSLDGKKNSELAASLSQNC